MPANDPLDVLGPLLENSAVAITVVDLEGRLTLFNRAAELLTGYRRDEVLGRPVAMFYQAPEDLAWILETLERDGKVEDFRTTLLRQDGSEVPVSILVTLLHDSQGAVVGSLGISVDISERVRLEKELAEARRQAEFYNDLLCHDIRNLDQTVLGYLDLLGREKTGPLNNEQRRLVDLCRRQAKRMIELLDRVRQISRLERGREAGIEAIPLEPILREAAHAAQEAFAARGAEIRHRVTEDSRVLAGPLLREVLFNLLSNGILHNPSPRPRVWVSTQAAQWDNEASCRILIEDNGPGIEDERKQTLFEGFVRGNPGGSGVGISLVKALVESYGGRIWVEDRIAGRSEEGSRFVVELRAAGS
jgi:PAS domain S-box-containing protein